MVRLVSSVRFRQGAPRRRSSVGKSTRLIIVGSPVRVRPPLQGIEQRSNRVAKNEKRVKVTLACEVCKRRNYITMKNKQNDRERIEMRKYCPFDRQHTLHKETR